MKFKGNKELPSLEFIEEKGIIKIWGRSIGINAVTDFWMPLFDKLEEYVFKAKDIELSLDLEYFSTSSSKALYEIFKLLQAKIVIKYKKTVVVKWIYDDENLLEAGEDYNSLFPKLTWKYIEK